MNNMISLQNILIFNCIRTNKNKLRRILSAHHKLHGGYSVLKVCDFTIFKGVSKVRSINNAFSLNTLGHALDEYIKI